MLSRSAASRLVSAVTRTSKTTNLSAPMNAVKRISSPHLGMVPVAAAVQQQRSVAIQSSCQRDATWKQDENDLWWHGETDGPYIESNTTSAPPLSSSTPSSASSGKFTKIPFTAAEILPVARALAIECNVAALSTIAEISPGSGQLFPRSRSVSTRHYISKDFEVSIATKIFTRKVEEIRANPHCSFLWKYESDEKKTTGGWVLAIGEAKVVPHENVGKCPEVDGHDKAKIVFTPLRLEVQDYPNHILAGGHDKWRCIILERRGSDWVKLR